jgi:hypothetical protein
MFTGSHGQCHAAVKVHWHASATVPLAASQYWHWHAPGGRFVTVGLTVSCGRSTSGLSPDAKKCGLAVGSDPGA